MPTAFKWTGKTSTGQVQSGELVAANRDDAVSNLRRQGIIPISVTETSATPQKLFTKRKKKVTDRDLAIFTRQFSIMFTAGIPIVQGLDILLNQVENKTLGETVAVVKSNVEHGTSLADALKRHPKVFNELYVNLVAAGETGGILDDVLLRLSVYIEKAMKLKKKVKGAMIYPGIVVSVAVLVVAIIMIFVIPVFAKIFSEMGVALPLPTRMVVAMSNFLGGVGGLILLAGLVAGVFSLRQMRRTEKGKKATDRIALKLPIFGDILRKVAVARFARTLGTVLTSGVPILDGLDICARSAGNKIVEEVITHVRTEVATGKTMSEPLSRSWIFPPMVVQMVSVGESTGSLDQMLVKIADFYDDEVDNAVANLSTILEPALMVFLGTVIGFIVIALYLPIFKLGSVLGG
ncbi:MAG: type II secretion system F family protein [Nitrospirales bacterium]|nr:type II secretion system F family protein [Nitrospirales bacterium]